MNYKKNLLLLFEGADGSGKDTLINILKSIPQFKNVEMKNRSTISEKVFAAKFNRQCIDGIPVYINTSYWEYYFKAHYDTRIILCNPNADTLALRCISKNDPIVGNKTYDELVEHLQEDKRAFEETSKAVAKKYDFKLLDLDTNKTIDECLDIIEGFIEDARV